MSVWTCVSSPFRRWNCRASSPPCTRRMMTPWRETFLTSSPQRSGRNEKIVRTRWLVAVLLCAVLLVLRNGIVCNREGALARGRIFGGNWQLYSQWNGLAAPTRARAQQDNGRHRTALPGPAAGTRRADHVLQMPQQALLDAHLSRRPRSEEVGAAVCGDENQKQAPYARLPRASGSIPFI